MKLSRPIKAPNPLPFNTYVTSCIFILSSVLNPGNGFPSMHSWELLEKKHHGNPWGTWSWSQSHKLATHWVPWIIVSIVNFLRVILNPCIRFNTNRLERNQKAIHFEALHFISENEDVTFIDRCSLCQRKKSNPISWNLFFNHRFHA